jgi:hypothetical protein
MYAEQYDKGDQSASTLIADFPEEVEVQASARAHVRRAKRKCMIVPALSSVVRRPLSCRRRIFEWRAGGFGDDPSAAGAETGTEGQPHSICHRGCKRVEGNKEQALSFLKQSIHHGPENRFHAAQDNDFATLVEEPAFRELLTTPESRTLKSIRPRILSIGGGTGLSTLLRGLKSGPGDISVIVTVTDDGGSSGSCAKN